ncbi:GSK-3-binding protein-like [Eucyclogobius newberryi]|uniref:GSK-3-binding protein-like n=1 Tax=Eucyclogobius newberryi TaxID=166745 RepID=UPI003B59043D
MPCRKENYIFLEQSVTVDSKEVDALVTKIGEALQLHNNNTGTGHHHLHHGLTAAATAGGGGKQSALLVPGAGAGLQRGHGCCLRLRSRGHHHRGSSRASPYHIPGSGGDREWDQIRPWSRKRLAAAAEEDDPHRLLQELILSGNLIKEAVRRLQFSGDCADNVSC